MQRPTIAQAVLCGLALVAAALFLRSSLEPRTSGGPQAGDLAGTVEPPVWRTPVTPQGPPPPVHVIAHRGATRTAPENTLAAFRRASELGAVAVECDVLFTADDVPVVAHHEDLEDRVPPQQRPARISEMTLDELKRVDAGAWFSEDHRGETFPTLGEALHLFEGRFEHVYLHDKHTNDYRGRGRPRLERFIDEIRRSGIARQVIVMVESGFELDWLRLAPEIALMKCWIEPVGDAGPAGIQAACRNAFAAGFRHFGIEHNEEQGPLGAAQAEALRSAVSRYKALGCGFTVFTVNEQAAMEQFLELGFTGIGTDDVARGLALLHDSEPESAQQPLIYGKLALKFLPVLEQVSVRESTNSFLAFAGANRIISGNSLLAIPTRGFLFQSWSVHMLKKSIAALLMLSLALVLGCGGDDEPQPEGGAPAAGAQAGTHGAAPAGHAPAGASGTSHSAQRASAAATPGAAAQRGSGAAPEQLLGGLGKHIPAAATGAVVGRPVQMLGKPPLAGLDLDKPMQQAVESMGIDPREIETVVGVFWTEPSPFGPPMPGGGAIVRLKSPYDRSTVGGKQMPVDQRQETTAAGKTYYCVGTECVQFIDDRTLAGFQQESAEKMLTTVSGPTPLTDALAQYGQTDDVQIVFAVTDEFKQGLPNPMDAPPQFQQFLMLGRQLRSVGLQGNLSPEMNLTLRIVAENAQAAQQAQQAVGMLLFMANGGIEMVKQTALEDPPPDVDPEQIEQGFNMAQQMLQGATPKVSGTTVELTLTGPAELSRMLEENLPKLLAAAEEGAGTAGEAAERSRSMNNLKQIMIAFHNHHDAHQALPAKSVGGEVAGLSWRVQLLPFLEEQALYEQFKLDEPWDSEHNEALIEQMPAVFAASQDNGTEPGHTRYLAVSGAGTAFDGREGKKFRDFTDGLSNSIIVVEAAADQAVPWTKPDDLDIADEEALQKLLTARGESFLAALADGRVTPVNGTIDLEMLRNAFTIADGNPINLD